MSFVSIDEPSNLIVLSSNKGTASTSKTAPAPVDVIVENTEFDPVPPTTLSLSGGLVEPAAPAPTVIGNVVADIVRASPSPEAGLL